MLGHVKQGQASFEIQKSTLIFASQIGDGLRQYEVALTHRDFDSVNSQKCTRNPKCFLASIKLSKIMGRLYIFILTLFHGVPNNFAFKSLPNRDISCSTLFSSWWTFSAFFFSKAANKAWPRPRLEAIFKSTWKT